MNYKITIFTKYSTFANSKLRMAIIFSVYDRITRETIFNFLGDNQHLDYTIIPECKAKKMRQSENCEELKVGEFSIKIITN